MVTEASVAGSGTSGTLRWCSGQALTGRHVGRSLPVAARMRTSGTETRRYIW